MANPSAFKGERSTRSNDMGVPPYVVEKMLNHTFDGVMAFYNHATYDAERRQALQGWSARLKTLVEEQATHIVSLRRAAQTVA